MKAEPAADHGLFITHEQVRAVNVLLAAAQVAQKNGAFSLADAKSVAEAVFAFAPPAPPAEEASDEEDSEVGSD
jgi:hypothetical protein